MCKLSGSLYPEDSNSHSQFLHFSISQIGVGMEGRKAPRVGSRGYDPECLLQTIFKNTFEQSRLHHGKGVLGWQRGRAVIYLGAGS